VNPHVRRAGKRLRDLQTAGLWRQRLVRDGPAGRTVMLDGRPCLNFSSNDYLGLTTHPKLCEAANRAMRDYGNGSSGSALVTGYSRPLCELEELMAWHTGREAAVVFSSGYLANLALAQVFCQRGQVVLEDRLNHASLIDSARLAGCRLRRYRHADVAHLKSRLDALEPPAVGLVASDAVFSMDGDTAPLASLAQACGQKGVLLAVDDAHGIGVFGPAADNRGQGSVRAAGLDESAVPVLSGTFGKAYAAAGAFIAGPKLLIDLLVNTARTYLFNTALSPAQAAMAQAAVRISRTEDRHRQRLWTNVARFRRLAEAAGLPLGAATGPIQPLMVGDEKQAAALADGLLRHGILARAMRYPTVPKGQARLRLTITAAHEAEDVQTLVEVLAHLLPARIPSRQWSADHDPN